MTIQRDKQSESRFFSVSGEIVKPADLSDMFAHDPHILRQAKATSFIEKQSEVLDCNNYPFDIVQRSLQVFKK